MEQGVNKIAQKKKNLRDINTKREIPWASNLVHLRDVVVDKCSQATRKLLTDPSPAI